MRAGGAREKSSKGGEKGQGRESKCKDGRRGQAGSGTARSRDTSDSLLDELSAFRQEEDSCGKVWVGA